MRRIKPSEVREAQANARHREHGQNLSDHQRAALSYLRRVGKCTEKRARAEGFNTRTMGALVARGLVAVEMRPAVAAPYCIYRLDEAAKA